MDIIFSDVNDDDDALLTLLFWEEETGKLLGDVDLDDDESEYESEEEFIELLAIDILESPALDTIPDSIEEIRVYQDAIQRLIYNVERLIAAGY
jgi:hypothetical protein